MAIDSFAFGRRVRHLREHYGLTIVDLAKRAEISKNSVLRIEHGLPSTGRVREQIASAFHTMVDRIEELPEPPYDGEPIVQSGLGQRWHVSIFSRSKSLPSDVGHLVQDPRERRRIAELGWASRFECRAVPRPCGGVPGAQLLEIWAPNGTQTSHPGMEMAYVVEGCVLVTVGTKEYELYKGDGLTFPGTVPHDYAPLRPIARTDKPPLLLYVIVDEPTCGFDCNACRAVSRKSYYK